MTAEHAEPSEGRPSNSIVAARAPDRLSRVSRLVESWPWVLGLAALAGCAAWGVGELTLDLFKPSSAASADPYSFNALNDQIARVSGINGALAFGALGGALGVALGIAGGLSRHSAGGVWRGGLAGLVLGSLAGGLPALVLMPLQWRTRSDDTAMTTLIVPLLFHLGLWVGAGLAAGLAFGVGRFGLQWVPVAQAGMAGLAGAILGTFVYEVAGALLFPFEFTSEPISASALTRFLARIILALFVGLGIARMLARSPEGVSG